MRAADVPPEMLEAFEKAKVSVKEYFDSMHLNPALGRVEIGKDRFVLAGTEAISLVLRGVLAEIYGERGSDQLLYAFGRSVGKTEAKKFFARFGLIDPMEKFGFGPTYFSYSGWAFVSLLSPSNPVPDETFLLVFANQKSFEAEAFLAAKQTPEKPICHINAGYLTGWCEESFGIPLETRELYCSARGEGLDLFLMTHRKRILEATENAQKLIENNQDLTLEGLLGK